MMTGTGIRLVFIMKASGLILAISFDGVYSVTGKQVEMVVTMELSCQQQYTIGESSSLM